MRIITTRKVIAQLKGRGERISSEHPRSSRKGAGGGWNVLVAVSSQSFVPGWEVRGFHTAVGMEVYFCTGGGEKGEETIFTILFLVQFQVTSVRMGRWGRWGRSPC